MSRVRFTYRTVIGVIALMVLFMGFLCGTPEPPLALLDVSSGEIQILAGDGVSLTIVVDEAELQPGDRIRVPQGGEATVIFFEGSVVLLDGGADITLEELSGSFQTGQSSISIFQSVGRTVSRVNKIVDAESSFGLRTSSSVGLVRGTGFIVEEDPILGTKWKSFEGTVGVAGESGIEVAVESGKSTEVLPDEDPLPPVDEPLTDEEAALVETVDEVIEVRDVKPPERKDKEKATPTLPSVAQTPPPTRTPRPRPPRQPRAERREEAGHRAEADLPPPRRPRPPSPPERRPRRPPH